MEFNLSTRSGDDEDVLCLGLARRLELHAKRQHARRGETVPWPSTVPGDIQRDLAHRLRGLWQDMAGK